MNFSARCSLIPFVYGKRPTFACIIHALNAISAADQEADIQRHRQRMVNAGHIEDIARGSFGPKRTQTFEQSAKTFEVRQTSI